MTEPSAKAVIGKFEEISKKRILHSFEGSLRFLKTLRVSKLV